MLKTGQADGRLSPTLHPTDPLSPVAGCHTTFPLPRPPYPNTFLSLMPSWLDGATYRQSEGGKHGWRTSKCFWARGGVRVGDGGVRVWGGDDWNIWGSTRIASLAGCCNVCSYKGNGSVKYPSHPSYSLILTLSSELRESFLFFSSIFPSSSPFFLPLHSPNACSVVFC